jgi:thiol-disulfide isomerase/thioredoxin
MSTLLVALALSVVGGGCAHPAAPATTPPSSPSRLLGAPAPAFRRPTLQGASFDTEATSGRVVVVDFFAEYCGPCRRALPALEALHRRRPELSIVGVSLDPDGAAASRLVARYRLTFPVVHDPGSVLAGRFRVTELPASFVIGRGGSVVWAGGGDQPEGALAMAAEAALGQPSATTATTAMERVR